LDWIQEYFVNPMAFPEKYAPYNPVNTITYAITGLLAAFLIYKGLKKYGVKINSTFFYSILPFVAFGSIVRVLVDAGVLPRAVNFLGTTIYPFITPGIYFTTFTTTIASLAIARITSNKNEKKFNKTTTLIGITLATLAILPLVPLAFKHSNAERPAVITLLALASLALFHALRRARKLEVEGVEKTTVFAQSLDGAATFAGVGLFGYGEQHVVGNLVINLGRPPAFYLIKTIFAILVVEVLRHEKTDRELKTFLLLLITIFGLAPGLRDTLRIFLGV